MDDHYAAVTTPDETPLIAGTAADRVVPQQAVPATQTAMELTQDSGWKRGVARLDSQEADGFHRNSIFEEWNQRTAIRARTAPGTLLEELGALGFSWRDVARMIGVSVPAVQKWRRGAGVTGENRGGLAALAAACDLIGEHYLVEDIASWFEVPILRGTPVTPIDLYASKRSDLVFEAANGHASPEDILNLFEPDWREHYRTSFEVFRAADGKPAIRRASS